MGESVTVKKMAISVKDYEVRKLEIVDGKRTWEYDRPVLAFRVSFKNTGKEPFRYTPTHGSSQMTESTTPLLYSDPGKKKALPPKNKTPINGVVLEKGAMADQITQSTKIAPGEELTDVFLFEVPGDEQADFIFSVPPSMHPGSMPALFRVPYKKETPEGPKWYGKGSTATLDGVKYTVTTVETAYVKTKNPTDGEGFSSSPVLKVTYEIANDSKEKVTYAPGHEAVSGRRAASLVAGDEKYARVKFGSNTTVVGQKNESAAIEPGASLTDFALFERPSQDVKVLQFKFPASRFGRGGLVRYNLPYSYEEPEKPEPLKKDEEEEEE
jgi:hypothetical protein